MSIGYDGKLYFLAFDHRGSFQKKMFGIKGDPTPEETERIADAKHLIYEGMVKAVGRGGLPGDEIGVLVDEQFGGSIPREAKEHGLLLALPVEKSGQDEFDFKYATSSASTSSASTPTSPRSSSASTPTATRRRTARSSSASSASPTGCTTTAGSSCSSFSYRPSRRSSREWAPTATATTPSCAPSSCAGPSRRLRNFGVEVDIWKIEGVEAREEAEMLARQTRQGEGREGVVCVLLGRGASDDKVDHWLRQAAPVEGFVGFAIGRSIWWDPLKGQLDGSLQREAAAQQIADNYLRFIRVYEEASQESAVA